MAKKDKKAEKDRVLKPVGATKAYLITVLLIIIAILIGARTSLGEMRDEAVELFFSGNPENSLDLGIEYDLQIRITKANNLLTVARRYVDENDHVMISIKNDCDKITKSNEPNEKFKYNEELTKDCYKLVEILEYTEISDTDADFVVDIIVDMESANQIIGHSEYNTKAKEFNMLLEQFPINYTSKLVFIKPLELFAY